MTWAVKDYLGPLVAVTAVCVGLLQYRTTAQSDFIKPVREAQLRLYQEASSAAARLATLKRDSPEWRSNYNEFQRLYYGPMAIVEDFDRAKTPTEKLTVEDAMILFKGCLDDETECKELQTDLSELSLALAHTCRESLARSWGYEVKQLADGGYQRFALDYRDKLRAKASGAQPKS